MIVRFWSYGLGGFAVLSFDTQVQVEEIIPDCLFCGEPLDGPISNGMHRGCNAKFDAEMAAAFPNELVPLPPDTFDRPVEPIDLGSLDLRKLTY